MLLTDAKILKSPFREKSYTLRDGKGLHLYITNAKSRIWRYRYRWQGRGQTFTLGTYPRVSIVQARNIRETAREGLKKGKRPSFLEPQIAAHLPRNGCDFETIARAWYATRRDRWNEKYASDVLSVFQKDVFPEFGKTDIADVTGPVILRCLRRIQERGATERAHRVRQHLSVIFRFAVADGKASADPAAHVGDALKPIFRYRHHPAIRDLAKVREVLRDCESTPATPVVKLAMRLLALTALRPGTLKNTPWVEFRSIGSENPVWEVPALRLKLEKQNKLDPSNNFFLPLAPASVDVIKVLHGLTSWSSYAFPNQRKLHEPLTNNALNYLLNRAGYHERHVPHGWRSAFSTIMNEIFPHYRDFIDAMLTHSPKDNIEAIYNKAVYMPIRREIAAKWAEVLVDGLQPASALLSGPLRRPYQRVLAGAAERPESLV